MKVRFLGTGAAGGWPNPYCACSSCCEERSAGRARSSTSLLVNEQILLDCGPAAIDGARALHQSLADVEHVVITHGHPDHLSPAFLLFRHWAHGPTGRSQSPLHVWAPPLALASCEPWIAPDDRGHTVQLHPITAGDELTLRTTTSVTTLRVLPASHDPASARHGKAPADPLAGEAVLLDLQDADGVRLLYATDTGPLSDAALQMTADRGYHLACIEETFGDFSDHQTGHLDLATFATTVEQLRSSRAITEQTRVVAVHLGHHNPPTPQLRTVLAPLGVDVLDDGTQLTIDNQRSLPGEHRVPPEVADPASGTTHLVLGGARSGKSRYAEDLAAAFDQVLYVACARTNPDDAEWTARIAAHRQRRPAAWRTEESTQLASTIRSHQASTRCILIDCLGTWVTALIDDAGAWQDRDRATGVVTTACADLTNAIAVSTCTIIIVSNEVGSGVVPGSASGRLFRDLLGIVNVQVAQVCDQVTLMIAGRALAIPHTAATEVSP